MSTVNPYDRIHKAAPDGDTGFYCAICGQPVKRVIGGQGLTYIHTDSGAVAAPNPPAGDPTAPVRKAMVESGEPQADLAAEQGQTWTSDELRRDFEVTGFMAPFVVVRRKSDGVVGSLEFTHSPRVYFNFQEDK